VKYIDNPAAGRFEGDEFDPQSWRHVWQRQRSSARAPTATSERPGALRRSPTT
jgi:hypothetical protein